MNTQTTMFKGSVEKFTHAVMKCCPVLGEENSAYLEEIVWEIESIECMGLPTLQTVVDIVELQIVMRAPSSEDVPEGDSGVAGEQASDCFLGLLKRFRDDEKARMAVVEPMARRVFRTGMRKAVREGDTDMITHIVDLGMAPDDSLHIAAEEGAAEAAETLLDRGYDRNLCNADGKLPEDVASECHNAGVIAVLQRARMKSEHGDPAEPMSHLAKPRAGAL